MQRVEKIDVPNNKLANVTNKLTYFALFLFYILALPFLAGSIASGIVIQFVEESFLKGKVNLGIFLFVFLISVNIFFKPFLMLKEKRKNILITDQNFFQKIFLQISLFLFPQLIGGIILMIVGAFKSYNSYFNSFLLPILVIFPFINLYYLDFFKIKQCLNINILKMRKRYTKLIGIQSVTIIASYLIGLESWVILISIFIAWGVFYVIFFHFSEYLKKKTRDEKDETPTTYNLILKRSEVIFITLNLCLVFFAIYLEFIRSPNGDLMNTLWFFGLAGLLIAKSIFLFLYFSKSGLGLISRKLNPTFTILLSFYINLCALEKGAGIFGFVLINIGIIIYIQIEKHYDLLSLSLFTYFLGVQVLLIDFVISFFILKFFFSTQTIIFTIILYLGLNLIHKNHGISSKKYNRYSERLFNVFMLEFSLFSAQALVYYFELKIFESSLLIYSFFIFLGCLILCYRKYHNFQRKLSSKDQVNRKKKYEHGLFGLIAGLLFHIFLIFYSIIHFFTDRYFFFEERNEFLIPIAISGLLVVILNHFILSFNGKMDFYSERTIKISQILHKLVICLLICTMLLISLSFSLSIALSVNIFSFFILNLIKDLKSLKIYNPKPPKLLRIRFVLYVVNLISLWALSFSIPYTYMDWGLGISLIICLIFMLLSQNYHPLLGRSPNGLSKTRKIIRLLNVIEVNLIVILSYTLFFSELRNLKFGKIDLTFLIFTLVFLAISVMFQVSSFQLLKGGFITDGINQFISLTSGSMMIFGLFSLVFQFLREYTDFSYNSILFLCSIITIFLVIFDLFFVNWISAAPLLFAITVPLTLTALLTGGNLIVKYVWVFQTPKNIETFILFLPFISTGLWLSFTFYKNYPDYLKKHKKRFPSLNQDTLSWIYPPSKKIAENLEILKKYGNLTLEFLTLGLFLYLGFEYAKPNSLLIQNLFPLVASLIFLIRFNPSINKISDHYSINPYFSLTYAMCWIGLIILNNIQTLSVGALKWSNILMFLLIGILNRFHLFYEKNAPQKGTTTIIKNRKKRFRRYSNLYSGLSIITSIYILKIANIPINLALAFSILLFRITIPKRFFNLFYHSLVPIALSLICYEILGYYQIGGVLSNSVFSIATCFTLEWKTLQKKKGSLPKSEVGWKIKSLLGYLSLFSWVIVYISYFFEYPEFIYFITPFLLFGIVVLSLILIKKLAHRERFFIFLIFCSLFGGLAIIGLEYLFIDTPNLQEISFSLSLFISSLFIILMFRKSDKYSKSFRLFLSFLSSVSLGTFLYYILLSRSNSVSAPSIGIKIQPQVVFSISCDIAIILYFILLGVHHRGFNKKIWDQGWYVWNLLPLANFTLILSLVDGIDRMTLALHILDSSINGSIILAIIICSLIYLPTFLTKLKHSLNKHLILFWVEFVVLTAWIGQNIYTDNIFLRNLFMTFLTLLSLEYVIYRFKRWEIFSSLWLLIGLINVIFLLFGFNLIAKWKFPLIYLIFGTYLFIYGHLPPIKNSNKIDSSKALTAGFLMIYFSIASLLYSFLILVFIHPAITMNITLIVMSFALLSGKMIGFKEKNLKYFLSAMSTANIALVVKASFNLIDGLEQLGLFLAIGFTFGSILIYQKRGFIPEIGSQIIWIGMSLFFSLSLMEVILSLDLMSGWGAAAIFIISFTSFFYQTLSAFNYLKAVMGHIYALGIVLLAIDFIIPLSSFIIQHQALIFLILYISMEILIGLFIKQKKYQIFSKRDKRKYILTLWLVQSILFPAFISLLLSHYGLIVGFDNLLIFLVLYSMFFLIAKNLIEQYQISYGIKSLQSFLQSNILYSNWIFYLSSSLVLARKVLISLDLFSDVLFPAYMKYSFQSLLFFGSLFFCLRVFDYYILKHISQETIYRSLILVYLGMNISIIFILFPFINQKLVLGILFLFLNYGQIFLLKHTAFYNNIYIALFFGVNTTLMTMFGGMLVFSFFKVPSISLIFAISGLYSFHKLDLISQKYVQRFLFIFNGTIYGLITFQIGMWLFSSLSWSVALLLMAIIIYIFTEFEIQYSFLPLYRSSIHKFRFFEWLFVIISSWLVIVRDIGFYFSVLNASIIALWFTLNFMYLSFLQKTDNNFQFTKNKFSNLPSGYSISRDTYSSRMQFLGILSYVEILTIFTCICSKFLSYSLQDDVVLLLMKLKVILLCLFGFGFGMIYLDRKNFHWIKNTIQNKIHRILLKSTHFVGSFFLGTAVFIASTETTSSPQIRAMENAILMRAIARALIWGVIPLSIGLHFFYNDRILDIIMYFLFSIATITFFMSFNSLFVIHSGILLSIVFLFLFHHKKIIMISKKAILAVFGIFSTLFTSIWQRLKSFGIWMKERLIFAEKWIEGQVEKIIQTLTKIYQFIFQMIKSIKVWIRDHGKILTFLAAGIAGILSYFYLENLALSFLLIMLIPVRYSPEYKSIKNANVFFYKMVYRAAIYACVVMIGNEYVPKVDWSASLYALIFFGYIIWIVRASEEIYGLSLYWRFLSSVAAIIDSGFMLYYVFF